MDNDRIEKVQRALKSNSIDALLVDSANDLRYLSYGKISSGKLLISKDDFVLFVSSLDYDLYNIVWEDNIVLVRRGFGINSDFAEYMKDLSGLSIGIDSGSITHKLFCLYNDIISNIVEVCDVVANIRAIKDSIEIGLLSEAAELGSKGFDFVVSILKEGISEKKVAELLKIFWIKNGAEQTSFPPIIAFGDNSAYPHAEPGNRTLKYGDTVLIDIGVRLNGYCSDMTRMVFFGNPGSQMLQIYEIVKTAFDNAIQACRPGESGLNLYNVAMDHIRFSGFEDRFTHGLGHGVGLQVHEHPYIRCDKECDVLLKSGMIITIEPGIYLPGVGGVRIEDTVLITDTGCLSLTNRNTNCEIL